MCATRKYWFVCLFVLFCLRMCISFVFVSMPGDPVHEIQSAYARPPASGSGDAVEQEPVRRKKLTMVNDRVIDMEALTVAFAAENNMSLSSVPKLITFAKVRPKINENVSF